jgi:hypothetical protein
MMIENHARPPVKASRKQSADYLDLPREQQSAQSVMAIGLPLHHGRHLAEHVV